MAEPLLSPDRPVSRPIEVDSQDVLIESPYVYEPLPHASSFRILELLPGLPADPISNRLRTADWTDPPPYDALSYAWGDLNDTRALFCDGKYVIKVSKNLLEAFQQLRDEVHPRYLWADAVCINQSEYDERARQVSHMRDIYANASSVLVWLGPDDKGLAEEASRFMLLLAEKCCDKRKMPLAALEQADELFDLLPDGAFEGLEGLVGVEGDCVDSWEALLWYFSFQWFSRLWVFQEVNAQPNVFVQCGQVRSSWHVVGLAANYLLKFVWQPSSKTIFNETSFLNAIIMRARAKHSKASVIYMLNFTRDFSASDPRDRIYALLGLPMFSSMDPPIKVDYRVTKIELYQDIASRCIKDSGDLELLQYAQYSETAADAFPSWVPQWDQQRRNTPLGTAIMPGFASGISSMSSHVNATIHGSVLQILGLCVDEVSEKTDIDNDMWFDSVNHVMSEHPILASWKAQQTDHRSYLTGESIATVSAKVYTAGIVFGIFGSVAWGVRAIDDYSEPFMCHFAAYIKHLMDISHQDSSCYPDMEAKAQLGTWQMYDDTAKKMTCNRSSFTTKNGYMGLGPQSMQPGDRVCIFFGAKTPFILRPHEGRYRLIGDAYVHGAMDGEIVSQYEQGKIQSRMFEIF